MERHDELPLVSIVKPEKAMKLRHPLDIKHCAAGYESGSSQDLAESDHEDRDSSGVDNEDQ